MKPCVVTGIEGPVIVEAGVSGLLFRHGEWRAAAVPNGSTRPPSFFRFETGSY